MFIMTVICVLSMVLLNAIGLMIGLLSYVIDLIIGISSTISKLLRYTDLKILHCSASGRSCLNWKINDFRESRLKNAEHLLSPSFLCCDGEWALRLITIDYGHSIDLYVCRISTKVELHNIAVLVSFGNSDACSCEGRFEVRTRTWYKIATFLRGRLDGQVATSLNNILTFSCILEASHISQSMTKGPVMYCQRESNPTQSNCANALSGDFEALLKNRRKCDVVLQVGGEKLLAHKLILGARSSVLAALLKQDSLENGMVVINVPDVPPSAVRDLLHYIYTGRSPTLTVDRAVELYTVASLYHLTGLMKQCVKIMLTGLSLKNVCQLATVADKYNETKIIYSIFYFALKHRSDLFVSNEWRNLLKNEPGVASKIMRGLAAHDSAYSEIKNK